MAERVEVREAVLKENDRIAAELRGEWAANRTLCLNLISSPGAGKTSILEGTLEALRATPLRVAVLTGDIQTERSRNPSATNPAQSPPVQRMPSAPC